MRGVIFSPLSTEDVKFRWGLQVSPNSWSFFNAGSLMIHRGKRKSKKFGADNETHNRGKLTLVSSSFSQPCPLMLLSSDGDTGAKWYCIVASTSPFPLEAHASLFRLVMKGIFDAYVLWPFDLFFFEFVTHINTRIRDKCFDLSHFFF